MQSNVLKDESLLELAKDFGKSIQKIELNKAIIAYEQLKGMELPERKLILPWLPEGGLTMVAAERGLGKTFFALSLAYAISNGNKFMRWDVQHSAGVLYVDGEMSLAEMQKRLNDLASNIPSNPLQLLSHEYFYAQCEADLSITNPDIQQKLLNYLDSNKNLRVIILDNLSSLARIREDKSDDWREFMLPFLLSCRKRGIAVVLIHHCGKSGDQRGTGAREDHLDTSIKLSKLAEDTGNEGCQFKLTFTKSRSCYGDAIAPLIATLKLTSQGGTWEISAIAESTKDKLIELVSDKGDEGITVTEAAKNLNVSKGLVSRFKKQCEEEGIFLPTIGKSPVRIAFNCKGVREC